MIMKYYISSTWAFGAILSVILAATPAWGRDKPAGDFVIDGGLLPFGPSPLQNDIPIPKKKPLMHTVQEDSIETNDLLDLTDGIWQPPRSDWIYVHRASDRLFDVLDLSDPTGILRGYQPEPIPVQLDLWPLSAVPRWTASPSIVRMTSDILQPTGSAAGAPFTPAPVPAPGALALLALGLGSMLTGRHRR